MNIIVPTAALAAWCPRNGVRRLSLFGSVLRDDFHAGSDIDVLVEFLPGRTPGFAFFTLEDELSALFGRTVDLHTAEDLSPYFRQQVVDGAHELYNADRVFAL